MIQLIEKYWHKFNKDGVLFEKLCLDILKEVANENIKKTKQTRDHGHDLEGKMPILKDDYMIIWGECKYHSKKLSLQKISSTLVMAFLNDVEFLYFFSYSAVTKEFEHHITDFCDKAKIHHKIYDDIKLEALLLDYVNSDWFANYFPEFKPLKKIAGTGGLKITSILKKNNTDRLDDSDKEYTVNETFQYCIYIKNDDIHNQYNVDVCMTKSKALSYVEIISSNSSGKYAKKVTVPSCSTTVIIYKLRIINFIPKLVLPEIVIKYDAEIISLKKEITVNWLAEVPLLGSDYSNYLVNIQKKYTNLTKGCIIHIYGKSGCGKSRIINETLNLYDKNMYYIISFDAEHQSLDITKIITKIVSTLERLPDYIDDAENIIDDVQFKEYHRKTACHILYDKNYDILKNMSEIFKYLEYILNKHKAIIAFDNLQNCSNDVVKFCQQLMSCIFKQNSKSVVLVCINMDQVYEGDVVENLHNTLLLWETKNPDYCVEKKCANFDRNMAKLYLKKTISPQIKSDEYLYEQTFMKIIDTVGTNPFVLQQTLLFLAQKEIMLLSSKGTFYFKDIEHFDITLNTLSPEIMGVLKLREDTFLMHMLPDEAKVYKQIVAVLLFFKTVPHTLFFEIIDRTEVIKAMRKSGFISDLQDKDISFYHNYFYLYYKQNFEYRKILKELCPIILNKIDELFLKRSFFDAYFVLCYRNFSLNNDMILDGVNYIIKSEPKEQFFDEYCEIILLLIKENRIIADIVTKLKLFKWLCLKVTRNRGVRQGNTYYDTVVDDLLNNYDRYVSEPKRFFNIIKGYTDNLNQLYDSEKTLNIIGKAENIIPLFQMEESVKNSILSMLYNRKSIPLKDQGDFCSAILYMKKALDLSMEIDDYELCISNCHDYGYLFYSDRQNIDSLTNFWNKAFEIYQEHLQNSTDEKVIVSSYANAVISDLIQFSFKDAREKIKVLEEHINKTHMPFYENKIRLVRTLYYLIAEEPSDKNQKLILRDLREAQDYCVVHNYNRDYYKCFYLEAINARKNFNFSEALDNYCISLQCIVENFKGNRFPSKYYPQILDIVMQSRILRGTNECRDIIKGITDPIIKKESKKYLQMSEEDFCSICDSYTANTPIIDPQERFGYPSI